MTTPQEILTGAYGYSSKNTPGQAVTEATEGFNLITRAVRGLFAFGARVNRYYFAESQSIAHDGAKWPRPTAAESVWRIEDPNGNEVVVVPVEDKEAETSKPAVYRFGQGYYGAGNAQDPSSGNLTFFYSKVPDTPADKDSAIDALWPESYDELLMLEVATYMAIKDARMGEAEVLQRERDSWLRLFMAHLEHETANERRRYGQQRVAVDSWVVPTRALLAGGTEVSL